jgi:hypothetical protein
VDTADPQATLVIAALPAILVTQVSLDTQAYLATPAILDLPVIPDILELAVTAQCLVTQVIAV